MLRSAALALFLIWLNLTGSYPAWGSPWLGGINLVIFCALWLRVPWAEFSRIFTIIAGMAAIYAIQTIVTGGQWESTFTLAYYAAMIVWFRPLPDAVITTAAAWAWAIYSPMGLILWWVGDANSNVVGFSVLLLALLTGHIGLMLLSTLPLLIISCLGGLFSLIAVMLLVIQNPALWMWIYSSMFIVGFWYSPASYTNRLAIWEDALRQVTVWGVGPGNATLYDGLYWHAHNVVLTAAVDQGVIIAGIVVGLIALIVTRLFRGDIPRFAQFAIVGFFAWATIDDPHHFWGAGSVLMLALSRLENDY